MELKPIRNGLTIALLAALAAFVMAYLAFIVVYITIQSDSRVLLGLVGLIGLGYIFVVLVQVLLVGGFGWLRLLAMRHMQSLRQRDPAFVTTARAQPDRSRALHDGESLTLAYMPTRAAMGGVTPFANLALTAFFSIILGLFGGEALLVLLLPAFGQSAFNPLRELLPHISVVPSPTMLDWLSAAFPLVVAALGFVAPLAIGGGKAAVGQRIVADDQGITLTSGKQLQHIPWSDIALFARTTSDTVPLPYGGYTLWGQAHQLQFEIEGASVAAMRSASGLRQPLFLFDGGYEAYQDSAERLLATIAARSSAPLLAVREMSLATRIRRRMPVLLTSEEVAKTLPVASQEYQPHVDATSGALRFGEQLTLRARIAVLPILRESLIWMAAFGVILAVSLSQQYVLDSLFAVGPVVGYIVMAFFVALLGLLGVALAFQRRRNARPDMTIDGFGVTGKGIGEQKAVMIPWQNVTAWVVIPPPAGSRRPTRYVAYGDGHRITWSEPADAQLAGKGVVGDRRIAYRALAERIHAIIAGRTGQPLRELRTDSENALPQHV